MSADVVPLPDALGTCTCAGRPNRHSTTCAVAIAYDERPFTEYETGKRYAAVSWDYPLRISGSYNIEVELDPLAVIKAHRDEYEAFELGGEYAEWEKPVVFLCHLIEDQLEVGISFGKRRLAHDLSYLDELKESHWSKEDTDRLHAGLVLKPSDHPGQGALL